MKSIIIFPVVLCVVLGRVPERALPWELRTVSVCRYGFLNLACSIGVIRIHDSTFGVYSNQTFCDPDFTYCDNISTAVNYPFHTEIRRKCFGKEFCSVRSSVGEVPEALCHRPFSDIVKITYCCVLNPYTPCQEFITTTAFPQTPVPESTTGSEAPPWITPNSTTTIWTTTVAASGGDDTALIAGIVGGLAGGAVLVAVIVIVIKKCINPCDRSKSQKKNNNVPPPVNDVKPLSQESPKPPGIYYMQPVRDQDSHHYQPIDWSNQPYYNVYNQYESIEDINNINEARENDGHYEEIGNNYLGLYGSTTT